MMKVTREAIFREPGSVVEPFTGFVTLGRWENNLSGVTLVGATVLSLR